MKLYKLTKRDGSTHNGYDYAGQLIHEKPYKENPSLCSTDVFHAYKNANLAFMLNPIHADIVSPRLFEIEGDVVAEDWGKVGSFRQEVIKELPIPDWVRGKNANKIRVYFAILCAESVFPSPQYAVVKSSLLSGDLGEAARAARAARAADAARAVVWAARAARAADAARAVVWAVADAAAEAADAAAYAAAEIDFCALADEAINAFN